MHKPLPWILCALLAGCSPAVPTPPCVGTCFPLESWCAQQLTALRCANEKACGRAADLGCNELLPWPTFASATEACPPLVRDAVDAGTVKYDEDAAVQCLKSLSTQCSLTYPGCDAVLRGTVSSGQACRTRLDCAPGGWCEFSGCPGTCRAKQPVGSEVTAVEGCATPAAEPITDGGYRCREYSQLGEACEAGRLDCGAGLACASDGGCIPASDAGAYAAKGQRCTGRFAGIPLVACLGGLACQISDGGTEGTCGARYEAGESCRADATGCAHNVSCQAELCVGLGRAGDGCVGTFECVKGLACRTGRCGAKAGPGDTCAGAFDCRPELRCVQGRCGVPLCAR